MPAIRSVRGLDDSRGYPHRKVSPFWIWMQVVIMVCVLISAVIAVVKLV
jgi:hypothetical protein